MDALRILSPIHRATRQIGMYLEGEIKPMGVSIVEGHILSYLLSYSPCSIRELNRVFGYKPSTLTSILDRLVERDLITRRVNPGDRRSWIVILQTGGKGLALKLRKLLDSFESEVLKNLDRNDIESFNNVMEAIAKVTEVKVRNKS